MARRNKSRQQKSNQATPPPLPAARKEPATENSQSLRETIESIVIAFVLAFLFRTFEAEAFVIPTGSMAPTLMGRHKDIFCNECGKRFQITASEEATDEVLAMRRLGNRRASNYECLAGVCPMCRHTNPVRSDGPPDLLERQWGEGFSDERSFAGDRILVNKYIYSFSEPQRWDVVVFKFPGNAQQNYIKRMVGLPNETLQVYQGDLFVGPEDAGPGDRFDIARKPPEKVHAMRQLVHDTDYESVELYQAGWPFRWQAANGDAAGWEISREPQDKTVRQRFAAQPSGDQASWIRYQHFVPNYATWLAAEGIDDVTFAGQASTLESPTPRLIADFNAYNARIVRGEVRADDAGRPTLKVDSSKLGLHWVGDLVLEADVDIHSNEGELLLDLVEAGRHFTCTIDLASGEASLAIDGYADFAPAANTSVSGTGSYRVALANVDDQLLLWIDDELIRFDAPTTYDAEAVFGDRQQALPRTSEDDPGDLAPAGVGAQGTSLEVNRLRVFRDIYYIATDWRLNTGAAPVSDLPSLQPGMADELLRDPQQWETLSNRRKVSFSLGSDQFFVMGDNSPESLDARLWRDKGRRHPGRPGGAYLERQMLIGKALCVYWPHAWYHIPGTPVPVFPNFGDMRLVR